jgi:putative thioredoxin
MASNQDPFGGLGGPGGIVGGGPAGGSDNAGGGEPLQGEIIGGGSAGAGSGGPAGDLIKDGDTQSFAADVMQASQQVPVLVDFWADWCGPCKQLTPVLEKVVREMRGAVKLVKINVDQNQQLAGQLRIQSLPTVMAFKNGQPVDGFMGALPESQIKQFIQSLSGDIGPSPIDQALEQAKELLENKQLAEAAQLYGAVLQEDRTNAAALGGLARCYLENGDAERAQQTLALVPPEGQSHPDVASAKAALDLQSASVDEAEAAQYREKLAQNPDDHQARLDLAMALHAGGDRENAVEELLEIVRRDRDWNDGEARQQLLKLFEAYGAKDPVARAGRRKLSSILFA